MRSRRRPRRQGTATTGSNRLLEFDDIVQGSGDRLYTRQFFQVFAAGGLFMTGLALQFHFGQFIEYLGHDVDTLGLLLAISVVGTLAVRLHIGRWIDRFGCKATWLVGTVIVAITVGSMQFADSLWLVGFLRAVSHTASAAVMTTVAVFAAQIAPPGRRAESMGTIGLAGFTGMILGSSLGDVIFGGDTASITPYRVFFTASAACSLAAGAVMLLITLPRPVDDAGADPEAAPSRSVGSRAGGHPVARPVLDERPADTGLLQPIVAHWPGTILLIGLLFSMTFCLQFSFLERLAEQRDFKDIKVFFLVYGPTAMVLRILFRRVPQHVGRTRTVLGGLVLQVAGILCLVGIDTQSGLILPGFLMGAGHCFVFPSMVDLGAACFPLRQRGTGTALILGAGDLGTLIGFVGLGGLIDGYGFDAAIVCLAAAVAAGALVFGWCRRDHVIGRRRAESSP